jgi:hypothetical protein
VVGPSLDLKAHDALLSLLGGAYQDIVLSQKDRPEGMKYFDFVMSEDHGLRVKELMDAKAAGRIVVGPYCVFVPEELILAVDGVSVGLCAGAEFNLTRRALTSHDPLESVRELIRGVDYDTIVATGYGRHLIKDLLDCAVIGEIKAFALGARAILPRCRLILDIGGQDTKAISLISERRPMHVMDLPQLPDEPEALDNWTAIIRKLQRFLESTFQPPAHGDGQA